MAKKTLTIIISICVVITSASLLYYYYFASPAPFPKNEQLMEKINETFPEMAASKIQDVIAIDETHKFVPYISKKGDYSLSYWMWKKHKWQVGYLDSAGQPLVWKVDRKDPSTYHIVWNLHPDDQIQSMDFYLIRDRSYHISQADETYLPQIQMKQTVSLQEKSYGVLQVPKEWHTVMSAFMKADAASKTDFFLSGFLPQHYMYFGWMPKDKTGEIAFPEKSVNGNSYGMGGVANEFFRFLDEGDLEGL